MRGETTAQYFGDYPNMLESDHVNESHVADCTTTRECRALETRQKRASPVQHRRAAALPCKQLPLEIAPERRKRPLGVAAFSYERNEEKEVSLS